MTGFARYAIYAAPTGPLARFAAAWLGWDPETGTAPPHPEIPGLPRPIAELTAAPRKYGFHGTLKPPFRLAPGKTSEELLAALAAFSAARVEIGPMKVARLGGFVALIPEAQPAALGTLAARIVRAFDGFRAPPTGAELARRRAAGLTPAQEGNLRRWGYPYVMENFRFHLTLTGNLPASEAEAVVAAIGPRMETLANPLILNDIALFGETMEGQFRLIRRYYL